MQLYADHISYAFRVTFVWPRHLFSMPQFSVSLVTTKLVKAADLGISSATLILALKGHSVAHSKA